MDMSRAILLGMAFLVLAAAAVRAGAQQGGTTRYEYDANGRLHVVIVPNGEAAVYNYDPAGNITSIERVGADQLRLFSFSPHEGKPGTLVTFVGTGFGGGVTAVSFNGAIGRVAGFTPSTLVAEVPGGATSGLVTIATPGGSVTTTEPFLVRDSGVSVMPSTATLLPGEQVQFTATVSPQLTDRSVTWTLVNGTLGNDATAGGTISATGLYTAPIAPPESVTVRATSNAEPTLYAEARVSFRRLLGAVSDSVSVGAGPNAKSAASATGLAVTRGPVVTAVSPTRLVRSTTQTLTIAGVNLTGATRVVFVRDDGTVDTTIVATNITVAPDGASLTVTVQVGAASPLERRLVVVTTPTSHSLTANAAANTVDVAAQ
jgi:hypothetical protein